MFVAITDALEELSEVGDGEPLGQPGSTVFPRVIVHQLLQVLVQVLEDEVELLFSVHHVQQLNDTGMLELL